MSDAIVLKHVTKQYGAARGISDVNLEVRAGEIFGFLGPNGAGKTTTIRTIMDFIRPSSGIIQIFGLDAQNDSVAVKAQVGYVPADRQLYQTWTGQDHIDFYSSSREKKSHDIAKRLGLDLSVPVKHLSTGNKQKLALSIAMYGQPKLLIMDEPTSGLDPLLQQEIYDILAEYKHDGGTVFLSSHNLPEVEKICDRVGIIREGKIIAEKSMQDIRDMSIHIVSISSNITPDIAQKITNLEVVSHSKGHTTLKVKGDINPLLAFIAKHPVHDIEINHASLEDIFLEFYK